MMKYLIVLTLLFGLSLNADTLESTVYKALDTNPEMRIAIQQTRSAQLDKGIARGSFLPSVNASYDTGKEEIYRDSLPTTKKYKDSATVSAALPVFRGFANSSEYKRSSYALQASYHDAAGTAEQIALRVSQAYLDYLKAKEILALSEQNVADHQETFDFVKQRSDEGVSDQSDLAQITGRLARAKSTLANARNNLRDAETVLVQLVGSVPLAPSKPAPNPGYLPKSLNEAVEKAVANNHNLIASQRNIESAESAETAAAAGFYPRVDVVGDASWKEDAQGFNGEEEEYRLFLRVNLDVFDGGKKFLRHRKAEVVTERTRLESERIEREVLASINAAWDAYQTLLEVETDLKQYVEATEKSAELYSQQFSVGRRTLLDVLDSQNELFSARQSYLQNEYDLLISQYRLFESMSVLLEALDLTQPDYIEEGL